MTFANSGSLGRGKAFSIVPAVKKGAATFVQSNTLTRPLVFVAGMRNSVDAVSPSHLRPAIVGQSFSGLKG